MMPPNEICTTPCQVHHVPPIGDEVQPSPRSDARERPILFSAPMVRALLAGTKTQTRRVVKLHPSAIACCCGGNAAQWVCHDGEWYCAICGGGGRLTATDVVHLQCPYGQPGGRLWVREAWRTVAGADDIPPRELMNVEAFTHYEADSANPACMGKLRPGMFMPRWASRILLEITGVRVERLQDISHADAKAEGCDHDDPCDHVRLSCAAIGCPGPDYRVGYRHLWERINGSGSWATNPWVWVVEFRRIAP